MTEPYLGEIAMIAGSFVPKRWMLCDGSLLQISRFPALYSIIGTTYGGDDRINFRIPDLRGRTPVCFDGNEHERNWFLGKTGGAETVILEGGHLPSHIHQAGLKGFNANNNSSASPKGACLAPDSLGIENPYSLSNAGRKVPMSVGAITATQLTAVGHNNIQPSLAINFIICVQGIFPSKL